MRIWKFQPIRINYSFLTHSYYLLNKIGKTSIPINLTSDKEKRGWYFIKNSKNEISISVLLSLVIQDFNNKDEKLKSSSSLITVKKNISVDHSHHDILNLIKSPTNLHFVKPDNHKGDISRSLNSFDSDVALEEENDIVDNLNIRERVEDSRISKTDIRENKQSNILFNSIFYCFKINF